MIEGAFGKRRPALSWGIHLISGAVGVLAGLRHLLSSKDRSKRNNERSTSASAAFRFSGAEAVDKRRDFFSIRRTKSELGYVYWVLQGHGEFQCFVLFDTWREAVDEATRRGSASIRFSDLHLPLTAC